MMYRFFGKGCALIVLIMITSCARTESDSLSSKPVPAIESGPSSTSRSEADVSKGDGEVGRSAPIGAWRIAYAEDKDESVHRFAMLPWIPPAGTVMAVYDFAGKEVVCCFRTKGQELSASQLEYTLQISPVRVMDLFNEWAEEPPYHPLVVELEAEGALVNHEFRSPYSGGAMGGLLLPPDTTVSKGGVLEISGVQYVVSRRTDLLEADDCTIETYVLQPRQGSAVRIEIPYSPS